MSAPFYDDLHVGRRFVDAPAVTLTEGLAAAHQSVVGSRHLLSLDRQLSRAVANAATSVAYPALVWDISIGHSTLATQRVIANLFYRGLVFHRVPVLGDSLRTVTEVVGLRDLTPRAERAPGGLAALHVVTTDQQDRVVLDFVRCAMLPLAPGRPLPDHGDDLERAVPPRLPDVSARCTDGWELRAHPSGSTLKEGQVLACPFADTVSNAPELARLTMNVAGAHHDHRAGIAGRRLVYGGHSIGLALSQLNRVVPTLVYVVGWVSCDHVAPVFEGDELISTFTVAAVAPHATASVVQFDVVTRVASDEREVLRWKPLVLVA